PPLSLSLSLYARRPPGNTPRQRSSVFTLRTLPAAHSLPFTYLDGTPVATLSTGIEVDRIPLNFLPGLDTANPTLVIGDRLKLIGEYQETIGTCYIFSEDGETATRNADTRPSETNLINEKHISDSNQASSKQVKPVASLYKALKFKPATDDKNESETTTKCL
ncbi:hypothetical protein ACMD2_11540, partial [Ananas comosus]